MSKHFLTGLLILTFAHLSFSQTKVITYYDSLQQYKMAEYFILDGDSSMIHGQFRKFHPDGSLAAEGLFEKGSKEGSFREYYPDGTLQRVVHYQDNMRHGKTEVFSEQGIP